MPPVTKEQLEARAAAVRTGGKGSVRRHVKTVRKDTSGDDKKVQNTLKRLQVQPFPEVEEVTFFKNDQQNMVFKNPRMQMSAQTQCWVVQGAYETKAGSPLDAMGGLGNMNPQQLQQMMQMLQQQQAAAGAAGAPAAEE